MSAARKLGSKEKLQQKSEGQCAAMCAVTAARLGSARASHILGVSIGICASLPLRPQPNGEISGHSRTSAATRESSKQTSAALHRQSLHPGHTEDTGHHGRCMHSHQGLCRRRVASASQGTWLSLRLVRFPSLVALLVLIVRERKEQGYVGECNQGAKHLRSGRPLHRIAVTGAAVATISTSLPWKES